jgi:hypothetical protein
MVVPLLENRAPRVPLVQSGNALNAGYPFVINPTVGNAI